MELVSRIFDGFLVLAGVFMAGWGLLGLIEYAGGPAPISLQNPVFPPGMQFLHFLAIFGSGVVFLLGYVTRWRLAPIATIISYVVLATLCSVQTLDMLQNHNRYILFVQECIGYIAIGFYLLRSKRMQYRFGNTRIEGTPS